MEAKCRQQAARRPEKSEAAIFDTLRSVILNRYPHLAKLVRERFPDDPAGEKAFLCALELFLRANLNAALDGWKMCRLVVDTETSLRAVGIMHVLPHGELPVEVTLSTGLQGTRYRLQIGICDSRWESLSDAKRWKAVYQFATRERDEAWTWAAPISGFLDDRII